MPHAEPGRVAPYSVETTDGVTGGVSVPVCSGLTTSAKRCSISAEDFVANIAVHTVSAIVACFRVRFHCWGQAAPVYAVCGGTVTA